MPLLGCIADGLIGASALAAALAREGLRTAVLVGAPAAGMPAPETDALVAAPGIRAASPEQAAARSLAILEVLRATGCRQFVLHFMPEATPGGDADDEAVGPVADALVAALGCGFAPVCPADPAGGCTVYLGHLFAGTALLGGSGGREANLVRALSRQAGGAVGLVPFATVERGPAVVRAALTALKEQGRRYGVVDALTDAHLLALGEAAAGQALLIGGAGLAPGLAANLRRAGLLSEGAADEVRTVPGHAAVLAGSCARATLFQLGSARDRAPTYELDPLATPDAAALAREALAWAEGRLGPVPVVIASSTTPDRAEALRRRLGPEAARALVADALATIAAGLIGRGARRLLVAGGEAGEAVAERLDVRSLRVGPGIGDGAAWAWAETGGEAGPVMLALKPGGAGGRDVFLTAFEALQEDASG